ncbi:MAG: EAL domain-containing response regulator [Nevskiales bacterium]|nr:EAL domain-containing response regulator [Nevskiales bacterium]
MDTTFTALLIEDDAFVRSTIARQLGELGASRVDTAADGAIAQARLASGGPFDLIVSDLMLPGLDGVELMRAMGQRHADTALVLISAVDESILRSVAVLSRQRGLRVLGALRKPVRLEALGALIAAIRPGTAPVRPPRRAPVDADRLQQAIARGDIELQAAPCATIDDGHIHSIQIRARWSPAGGSPLDHEALMDAAERHRFTGALTDYLIARSLQQIAQWWLDGVRAPAFLTLPVPALACLDFPDALNRRLRQSGVIPELFGIGVPEHHLSDDCGLLDVLSRLRMRDIPVCIDTFSSGCSPFVRLQRIPASIVRLDPTLLELHGVSSRLLEHALRTATSLQLPAIADGTAHDHHLERLRSLGCKLVQGPWVTPAVAAGALPAWMQSRPQPGVAGTRTPPERTPPNDPAAAHVIARH